MKRFSTRTALFSLLFAGLLVGSALADSGLNSKDYSSEINPYGNSAAASNIDYLYLHHEVPAGQELDFDGLLKLISSKGIHSIEDLIPVLPAYMRDDNYVVMYRSRSLQEASPTAPRILLFTPSASMVMTYNGGISGTEGSHTLEVMQYHRPEQRFEFRELYFDGKNAPTVSAPNPKACIACHQATSRKDVDMRPNWEPYATWLGALGSDDGMENSRPLADTIGDQARPEDQEALRQQAQEATLLKKYLDQVAPSNPRYSTLGHFNLQAPVELTEHLAVWNFERVVRLMKEQKEIYPFYRELVWFTARCSNDDYLLNNPYIQWARKQPVRKYYNYGAENAVSPILTDIFEPLGVDTSDWSMDFGTRGRFAFEERFGTPGVVTDLLEYALEQVDDADHIDERSCSDLKAMIQLKLGAFFAKGENLRLQALNHKAPPTGKEVVSRCLHCHAEDSDNFLAPTLPLDQPSFVSRYLHAGGYKRGTLLDEIRYRTSDMALEEDQMPPSVRLTQEERQALLDYLESLANQK